MSRLASISSGSLLFFFVVLQGWLLTTFLTSFIFAIDHLHYTVYNRIYLLVTKQSTMKISVAFLGLLAASVSAVELTPDNYDHMTAGKNVFIKFVAPW